MRSRLHFVLLFISAVVAAAQGPGAVRTIKVILQDPSGALIPGAQVVVAEADGKTLASGVTDGIGTFSFTGTPARTYLIDATREGFRETKQAIKGTSIRIVMPIATVSENVTVTGSDTSAQISTDISQNQSGNTIDSNALDRFPVFDQDYITMMSRFLDDDSTGTNGTTLVVNGVEANEPGVMTTIFATNFDMLGTFEAGKWFNFGTALSLYSGLPVNITTGNDDYNDGMSNARPMGVSRNSFDGPGYVDLDLNLAHDFPLTKQGDKGPTATLSLNSFNVLNHVNDMTYIGVSWVPVLRPRCSCAAAAADAARYRI